MTCSRANFRGWEPAAVLQKRGMSGDVAVIKFSKSTGLVLTVQINTTQIKTTQINYTKLHKTTQINITQKYSGIPCLIKVNVLSKDVSYLSTH